MQIPTRFAFDSAAAFSQWLATKRPHYRHELTDEGVKVTAGPFSAVVIRSEVPAMVEVRDMIPSGAVELIVSPPADRRDVLRPVRRACPVGGHENA